MSNFFIDYENKIKNNHYTSIIGGFSNYIDINESKGIIYPIIQNETLFYNKCKSNCNFLFKNNYDNCINFCDMNIENNKTILDFAKNQCPTSDIKCCKLIAKDNDFAFLKCIEKKFK